MRAICLHDKQTIEAFLRQNTFLHLYEIGDLDDFFWQYTTWYALQDQYAQINQLALLYTGGTTPVLLGLNEDLEELYSISYPGNWFDARMLETDHYFGIYDGKQLASIAGIHVYSPHYKVAVLGNVTTHPDYRKLGMGTATCAKLCQVLYHSVEHI